MFVFFPDKETNSCGVLTAYFGKEPFTVKKQETDKEGGILILAVSIDDSEFLLINFYKPNIEIGLIDVLSNILVLLEEFDINPKKQLIMAGDFNLFFDSKLDAQGANPTIKTNSLAKLIEIKESYMLCDIWRVRNTKSKQFILRKNILLVSLNVELTTCSFQIPFKNLQS